MSDNPPDLNQLYNKFADVGTAKHAFYDWYGLNEWLFLQVNAIHGDFYDHVMVLLSRIGDHEYFMHYFIASILCAFFFIFLRKLQGRAGMKAYISKWIGVLLVLPIGFAAVGGTTKLLKAEFAFERPYAAVQNYDVVKLEKQDREDTTRSFPSGHASFSLFMLLALWPVLAESLRTAGTLLVLGIGWSRMALGVHFPADVLGGFIVAAVCTLIVRAIITYVMRALFKIHC